MLGVNVGRITGKKKGGERRNGSTRGQAKKGLLKVVYISSPMMVKTSAAEFRSTVQELTGRDSDVARLMESGDWYHQNREEAEEGPRPRSEDRPQNSNQSQSDGSGYYPNSFESDSPSEWFQQTDVDVYDTMLFQDSTLLEALGSFDAA